MKVHVVVFEKDGELEVEVFEYPTTAEMITGRNKVQHSSKSRGVLLFNGLVTSKSVVLGDQKQVPHYPKFLG